MTEVQFRADESYRNELRDILSNSAFRNAYTIIITKRRVMEQQFEIGNLNGDALQSLRLFNQRLGAESIILELNELTTPLLSPPEDPVSTFGADEAFQKLNNLIDANNQ
jgi:hypothetical protein